MQSQYANAVPAILAEMERERQENENPTQPTQDDQEPEKVVYVYPLEGGGLVFTETPIEDEPTQPPIVDSNEPEPDTRQTPHKDPPYFLHFLLLLFLFIGLDNIDAVFAPTVTVTISPVVKTISTTAHVSIGEDGGDIHGRVLAPLTVSQTQTVNATGKGHQNATRAAGQLTFYNGLFTAQYIPVGTVFTGQDEIQVTTSESVTVPPGNPNTGYGTASITAQATQPGAAGNIATGDIQITINNGLLVKNSQFAGGRDARDFTYITKADIQTVVTTLTPHLVESEQAALTAQLVNGESLVAPTCTPSTSVNHSAGTEAQSVTVAVSETCTSLAYNPQELERAGIHILTTQEAKTLGKAYTRIGDIHVSITRATNKKNVVLLSLDCQGTWVYALNERELTQEIIGKPRLTAFHLLEETPGVQTVSIAGVSDNAPLPTDAAHIHLSIFYLVS